MQTFGGFRTDQKPLISFVQQEWNLEKAAHRPGSIETFQFLAPAGT